MKQQLVRSLAIGAFLAVVTACAVESTQNTADGSVSDAPQRRTETPAATVLPTPTFVPTGRASAAADASEQQVRIEDTEWQGSYRRANGPTTYGGRSATWIYGTTTDYATMRAEFQVRAQPAGEALLVIEGMDSEDRAKTPIQIKINETEIFNGANPLPNDDLPFDTGTWASYTWRFDAALLHVGANTVTISNLAPGQFSRPPFFMLDYAEIQYEAQ